MISKLEQSLASTGNDCSGSQRQTDIHTEGKGTHLGFDTVLLCTQYCKYICWVLYMYRFDKGGHKLQEIVLGQCVALDHMYEDESVQFKEESMSGVSLNMLVVWNASGLQASGQLCMSVWRWTGMSCQSQAPCRI
jgi:hypothetical protein